jgi:hypothetical protein
MNIGDRTWSTLGMELATRYIENQEDFIFDSMHLIVSQQMVGELIAIGLTVDEYLETILKTRSATDPVFLAFKIFQLSIMGVLRMKLLGKSPPSKTSKVSDIVNEYHFSKLKMSDKRMAN